MKTQILYGDPESYAFPVYRTRADYAAAHGGVEAPPFDETLPPKNWEDPTAAASNKPKIVYLNCLMEQEDGTMVVEDGELVTAPISLPRAQAASVNMLPEDKSHPSFKQELKCPFRTLMPGEKLMLVDLPGIAGWTPVIRNVAAYAAEQAALAQAQINDEGKFTPADRALLKAVARAVGVEG